jgi:hypothetical protein
MLGLLRAFQEDADTFSGFSEWIIAFQMGSTSVLDECRAGRPRLDHIDLKMSSLSDENEYHSAHLLAQELGVSTNTVYDRLIRVLRFVVISADECRRLRRATAGRGRPRTLVAAVREG